MSVSTRIRCVLAVIDYVIFAIGGTVISIMMLPAYFLGRKTVRRWGCYLLRGGWIFIRWVLHVSRNLDWTAPQRERLYELRSGIIVANHPSLIDIVILVSLIPRSLPMAKPSLRKWFFLRPILEDVCLVNDGETEKLMERIREAHAEGYNIIIFPEGTRTSSIHPPKLHRGAAQMAIAGQAPIYPVHIHASQPYLNKELPWWYVGKECPLYTITLKDTISPEEVKEMSIPKGARHLTRRIGEVLGLIK